MVWLLNLGLLELARLVERGAKYELIITIRNTYTAPNPTRLAESTSQFKTRMDIRINT